MRLVMVLRVVMITVNVPMGVVVATTEMNRVPLGMQVVTREVKVIGGPVMIQHLGIPTNIVILEELAKVESKLLRYRKNMTPIGFGVKRK
ncbi:MAG: hypothetical protein ACTSW1_14880 [Candidatus Hodarchaeales archaeon]